MRLINDSGGVDISLFGIASDLLFIMNDTGGVGPVGIAPASSLMASAAFS